VEKESGGWEGECLGETHGGSEPTSKTATRRGCHGGARRYQGEMTKGLIVATMVDLVAHMMIPGVLMSMWSLLTMGVGWGGQQSQAARGTRPG
jgi:hypothetical protein